MQIVFLLYAQRSGSTFLARQISQKSANAVVLPELNFIERLLLLNRNELNELEMKTIHEFVFNDHQAEGLTYSKELACRLIYKHKQDGIAHIICSLAAQQAKDVEQKVQFVFVKLSQLLKVSTAIFNAIDNPLFVHIYRDPRAVTNSALQSRNPYSPKELLYRGDPWYVAQLWCRYISDIKKLSERTSDVYEICYENFISDPSTAIMQLFIDLSLPETDSPGCEFEVSKAERNLHTLIKKDAVVSRIDAWREELTLLQGTVVEWVSRRQMKERGYECYYLAKSNNWKQFALISFGFICSGLLAAKYYYFRFIHYLIRPASLARRVALAHRRHVSR